MLISLDSVLNRKAAPNENYAREVLELFAFGVDNRYTQTDIEELARCFTGWTLRKVQPGERPPFPASARTPLTPPGVQIREDTILPLGAGWKYFKGRQEPSPQPDGSPALDWTLPGFGDTSWIDGATGMDLFTRDDPDGWSELGFDWMDTGSLLERIKFVQNLAGNADTSLTWNGSGGTDHADSSGMVAAGGRVLGGIYNGDATTWKTGDLFSKSGRYLSRRTDFRAVFAEVFTRHFGDPVPLLDRLMPGYSQAAAANPATFQPLGFLPA